MTKAIFTIVRNEKEYLPIWYRYYLNFFDRKDIYILDHDTTDGSTDQYRNVIKVSNKYLFDVKWLADTVSKFQYGLLKKYKIAIFAEADEIIVPQNGNFEDHLKDELYVRCTGFEVFHKKNEEPPIDWAKPILKQRNWWFQTYAFDKTLISKVPLKWFYGFHQCQFDSSPDPELILVHLRRIDHNYCRKRYNDRSHWQRNPNQDKNQSGHWSVWSNFEDWFHNRLKIHGVGMVKIPENIKNVI